MNTVFKRSLAMVLAVGAVMGVHAMDHISDSFSGTSSSYGEDLGTDEALSASSNDASYRSDSSDGVDAPVNDELLLYRAAARGNIDEVRSLIALGADYRLEFDGDDCVTPVHAAVMHGRFDVLTYFIREVGVPVDFANSRGETLLICAAKHADERSCHRDDEYGNILGIVHHLVERGANPYLQDVDGYDAVQTAQDTTVRLQDESVVQPLLLRLLAAH